MKTLNLKQVAEILDVYPETVRRYVRAGILPMKQLNGGSSPYKISEERFYKWFDEVWDADNIVNNIF